MRTTIMGVLFILLAIQALSPAMAQETGYQVFHAMELPAEFNQAPGSSCSVEFEEEWLIDPAGSSISKRVESFEFPCSDSGKALSLPDGTIRLKNISSEFSFLDLPEQKAKEIQMAFIALINKRFSIPEAYDPPEQLLSIYFHEDWTIESGHKVFTKRVRALTPVIWQRRQTADGEPLPDADTGYPVFYKLKLERIELRQP